LEVLQGEERVRELQHKYDMEHDHAATEHKEEYAALKLEQQTVCRDLEAWCKEKLEAGEIEARAAREEWGRERAELEKKNADRMHEMQEEYSLRFSQMQCQLGEAGLELSEAKQGASKMNTDKSHEIMTLKAEMKELQRLVGAKDRLHTDELHRLTNEWTRKEKKWRESKAQLKSNSEEGKEQLEARLLEQEAKLRECQEMVGHMTEKFREKMGDAQGEVDTMGTHLAEEMRRAKEAVGRVKELESALTKSLREAEVLQTEVNLQEREQGRLTEENVTLREEMAKMDRLVYGTKTSRSKSFDRRGSKGNIKLTGPHLH